MAEDDEYKDSEIGGKIVYGLKADKIPDLPIYMMGEQVDTNYSITSEDAGGMKMIHEAGEAGKSSDTTQTTMISDPTERKGLNSFVRLWSQKHKVVFEPEAKASFVYAGPNPGKSGAEITVVLPPEAAQSANCQGYKGKVAGCTIDGNIPYSLDARKTKDLDPTMAGQIFFQNNALLISRHQKNPVRVIVGDTTIKVWENGQFTDDKDKLTAQIRDAGAKNMPVMLPETNPNAKLPNLNQGVLNK